MRRWFLIVLVLIVFSTSYGVTSSAPVGKAPEKELKLSQIDIIYTTSKDIHFPVVTTKYAVWLEGSLFGDADIKSMNLETKEVFKLNEDSLDKAFFFAPGIGTTIMDEYALMLDGDMRSLSLMSLDGKEKTVITQGELVVDSRISWKGNKFYFHQKFKADDSKTGMYSYDIDEAKNQTTQKTKFPNQYFFSQ